LEWPDDRLAALRRGTTHGLSPDGALALAAALGRLPHRVVIYGIEGCQWHVESNASQAVTEAIPSLVEQIIRDLQLCSEKSGRIGN
jgi:hydrogenase maturation protease